MASLDGDNKVLFYYPSAWEIWLDKRSAIWQKWTYNMGTTV